MIHLYLPWHCVFCVYHNRMPVSCLHGSVAFNIDSFFSPMGIGKWYISHQTRCFQKMSASLIYLPKIWLIKASRCFPLFWLSPRAYGVLPWLNNALPRLLDMLLVQDVSCKTLLTFSFGLARFFGCAYLIWFKSSEWYRSCTHCTIIGVSFDKPSKLFWSIKRVLLFPQLIITSCTILLFA